MTKFFLATKNRGKIKEMVKILEPFENIEVLSILDGIDIPEVEEDGDTFEHNSRKKAVEIAKYLGMYVIADDSGIAVEALGGAPGVYSARYAGENATNEENNKKLLKDMEGKENRECKYVAVVTMADKDGNSISARGEVHGKLLLEEIGSGGFGYDPMFYVEEYGKTFGEIEEEIKNRISHRGKALCKLKDGILKFIDMKKNYIQLGNSYETLEKYFDEVKFSAPPEWRKETTGIRLSIII